MRSERCALSMKPAFLSTSLWFKKELCTEGFNPSRPIGILSFFSFDEFWAGLKPSRTHDIFLVKNRVLAKIYDNFQTSMPASD